jgi:hypothetical protein
LPRRSRCTASSHSYPPRTGRASVKNHSQHHHQAHVYGRRWGAPCALRLQLRELKALLRSRASLRRVHQSGPRYHMRERWATLALPPGTRNTSVLHTHPPVHHGSIACRRFPHVVKPERVAWECEHPRRPPSLFALPFTVQQVRVHSVFASRCLWWPAGVLAG